MILYRQKFFDALDDVEEEMEREEREERGNIDRERKRNIANRTKYNTFLSKYDEPASETKDRWGKDVAKEIAKTYDKLGYKDEEILDKASRTPLLDRATGNGAAIGSGIVGLSLIGTELYRKLKKGHFSPDGPNAALLLPGGIVGGTIGNIAARKLRKDAVKELLDRRRRDEDKNRIK